MDRYSNNKIFDAGITFEKAYCSIYNTQLKTQFISRQRKSWMFVHGHIDEIERETNHKNLTREILSRRRSTAAQIFRHWQGSCRHETTSLIFLMRLSRADDDVEQLRCEHADIRNCESTQDYFSEDVFCYSPCPALGLIYLNFFGLLEIQAKIIHFFHRHQVRQSISRFLYSWEWARCSWALVHFQDIGTETTARIEFLDDQDMQHRSS